MFYFQVFTMGDTTVTGMTEKYGDAMEQAGRAMIDMKAQGYPVLGYSIHDGDAFGCLTFNRREDLYLILVGHEVKAKSSRYNEAQALACLWSYPHESEVFYLPTMSVEGRWHKGVQL